VKRAGQRAAAQRDRTLEVVGLSHDGRGVAREAGKAIFIAGALPGETVRCRVTHSRPRFDEARLLEVRLPSPDRRAAPCPHYGRCGGCALQHLAAPAQLAARERQLADALARIARLEPREWLAPVASAPWAYRSRARLAVQRERSTGRVSVGFRRGASRTLEPLAGCAVLVPELSTLIGPLAALLDTLHEPGRLREIWLASGEPGVAMGVACSAAPGAADRDALAGFCAGRGIVLHLGAAGHASASVAWSEDGPPLRYAPAEGLELEFHPWHFTQANRVVNRAMVEALIALLAPRREDRVLDLFCGLGNFSLPLARTAAQLTGVEGDAALVAMAQRNAVSNGLANAHFVQADLAAATPSGAWTRGHFELVVLDPPRSGAAALLPLVLRLGARRIAYVACDAATFARDAAALCAGGYALTHAGILDMFPQTAHFETLGIFAARV